MHILYHQNLIKNIYLFQNHLMTKLNVVRVDLQTSFTETYVTDIHEEHTEIINIHSRDYKTYIQGDVINSNKLYLMKSTLCIFVKIS